MARILVVEPSLDGRGSFGAYLVCRILRNAGHRATRGWLGKDCVMSAPSEAFEVPLARKDFDGIFFSVITVRQYLDIPLVFKHLGLAPLARDRRDSDPIVAFGGQAAAWPRILAPFADVVALGDGEVTAPAIAARLATKATLRRDLAGSPGFYFPGLTSTVKRVEQLGLRSSLVYSALRAFPLVEAARGCKHRCMFCHLGWAGGTYREAPYDDLTAAASQAATMPGKIINYYAPAFSSHSRAPDLVRYAVGQGLSLLNRDLRVAQALDIVPNFGKGHMHWASLGIEGMSARIRRAVGKPISDDQIMSAMAALWEKQCCGVKWYVIVGFPGEEDDDVEEFLRLLRRVKDVHAAPLTVTVSYFSSLPHTPLQHADAHQDPAAVARWRRLRGEHGRWRITSIMGREQYEHDSAVNRADEAAADYAVAMGGRRRWIVSGKWREVAAATGFDVGRALAPAEPGAPTPWECADVGRPVGCLALGWQAYRRMAWAKSV